MSWERLTCVRTSGRMITFALAAFLVLAAGPQFAFSQDTGAEGTGSADSGGSSSGTDSAGASQSGSTGGSAESDGTDGAASMGSDAGAQANGDSGYSESEAKAKSETYAEAEKDGDQTHAKAVGTAGAAAEATVGNYNEDDHTKVTAVAEVNYNPTAADAEAKTKVGNTLTTKATAAYGASAPPPTTYCDNGCAKEFTRTGGKKTVAVAVAQDGSYSVAIAGKKSSFAHSGVYSGDLQAFSTRDIMAAARASAGAYAKAGPDYAEAGAHSWGKGEASTKKSEANAWAGSKAWARVGPPPKAPSVVAVNNVLSNCQWRPQQNQILFCYRAK